MALRTPLTAQPHLYIGDSTGRPLDYGRVYFGEPNKDPEFYPIDIYLDPEMTIAAAQPVRTKGGFMDVGGDLAELHAAEVVYSLKVLDQYGRQVFYKPEMYRNNVSDFLVDEITRATAAETLIAGNLTAETQRAVAAEKVIADAVVTEKDRAVAAEAALDAKHAALSTTINSLGGGKKAYTTYALMVADKNNIAANSSIYVTNDTDPLKNGTYSYDGAVFAKSIYDVEAIVRTKVLNTFKTKSLMDASVLPNGADAQVTNDTVNNGLYVKTAGAWVKSEYDPLAVSKKYTAEVFKSNSADEAYFFSDFTVVGGYNKTGAFNKVSLSTWRSTDFIGVNAGDIVNANYFVSVADYPVILYFDKNKVFKSVLLVTAGGDQYNNASVTIENDGYIVIQHNLLDIGVTTKDTSLLEFDLVSKNGRYLQSSDLASALASSNIINKKADLSKIIPYNDWTIGYVDVKGDEVADDTKLRTIVYKLPVGTVVTLRRSIASYQFGYAVSNNAKVIHNAGQWFAEYEKTVTITEDKPYIRFFVRKPVTAPLDLSAADFISITTESKVVYSNELVDITSTGNSVNSVGLPPFESNFRDPSRATGGVMTIIDDDGGSLLYSGLYPFLKLNEVPFGAAVMGGTVGKSTHEGRASVTLTQLKELCEDVIGFELMSHSWTHVNQVTSPLSVAEKILQVERNKQWFIENGFNNVSGFAYPYGFDDIESRNRVMKYYNAAYDYADGVILTPDNINNHLIKRYSFNGDVAGVQKIKNIIDGAVAVNGWIVVTVHVGHPSYWFADSYDLMQEIIDYAKSKGIQFMLPKDGFQTYGNFMESSNGFRIQADGKIVGAS